MVKAIIYLLFSFRGRISRRQWWIGSPISAFCLYFIRAIIAVNPNNFLAAILMGLPFLWIPLALHIKRHHDRGIPGLWTIFVMICAAAPWIVFINNAFGGFISLLWIGYFGCLRGDASKNRYGPPPKPLFKFKKEPASDV